MHAYPSAISGYDDTKADLLNYTGGGYQYLRNDSGLIETFEYDVASGFLSVEKVQDGENGTPLKVREREYVCCPQRAGAEKVSGTNGTVVATGCVVVWTYGNAASSAGLAEWALRREKRCARNASAYRYHTLDRRAFALRT